MRLQPIEKPTGLMLRIAYWTTRRQFGKVMTPLKVITARIPRSARLSYEISKFELREIRLDATLHFLLAAMTSKINGCGFCADLSRAMAISSQLDLAKFDALPEYRTSRLFSARERAALAYAEEATRHKRVADATFEELRRHFNEREIVEITWINAVENYYNLLNLPLGIESDGFCAMAQRQSVGGAARR